MAARERDIFPVDRRTDAKAPEPDERAVVFVDPERAGDVLDVVLALAEVAAPPPPAGER